MNTLWKQHHFKHPRLPIEGVIVHQGNLQRPGLGGVRLCYEPFTEYHAKLCVELAKIMQRKHDHYQLPFSGAKAIICVSNQQISRQILFEYFASQINQLNSCYITAVDMNVSQSDLDIVAKTTPFVTNHTAVGGDPSSQTALGILNAIETVMAFLPQSSHIRIAIQGIGKVGRALVAHLQAKSIILILNDVDPAALDIYKSFPNITVSQQDSWLNMPSDIFVPCAGSHVITPKMCERFNTKFIICGANAPFTDEITCNEILTQRGIVVVPDYLTNAGGVMLCAAQYYNTDPTISYQKIIETTRVFLSRHYENTIREKDSRLHKNSQ